MEGGWYPRDPWPTKALCEMSRVGNPYHPDDIELPDKPDVTEIDRALIEQHYPAAKTHPLIAGAIYNMAMGLCLANGKEWNWELPDADPQPHIDSLVLACSVLTDMVGSNGVVRDITDMEATSGPLDLLVPDDELATRQAPPPRHRQRRGYAAMYVDRVLQADRGCDFDFLVGRSEQPENEPDAIFDGWVGGW